jgi:hypothetical protein
MSKTTGFLACAWERMEMDGPKVYCWMTNHRAVDAWQE